MKTWILLICTLFIYNFSFSQEKVIEIIYYQQSFWEIPDSTNYSKNYRDALLKAMNEKNFYSLIANKNESIYRPHPKIDNSLSDNSVSFSFSQSESFIYKNLIDSSSISEETYPKSYYIKEDLINYDWILDGEEKKHLNYSINKASSLFNGYEITAWYTKEILFHSGPKNFWGLPGLILIIEIIHIDSGEKTQIVAEQIKKIDHKTKIKPTIKNKIISRDEFNEIFNNYIEKEKQMYGGGVEKN